MARKYRGDISTIIIFVAFWAGLLFCFANGSFAAEEQPAQAPSEQGVTQNPDTNADTGCRQLAELLQQQKNQISREAGQLKREIAALREEVSRPGIKEVFAGIGYIFGLAGIGFYMHSRKNRG